VISKSYCYGSWFEGQENGVNVYNALNGEVICNVSSSGVDFKKMLDHGREIGGKALRAMTIHERANAIKNVAKHLLSKKDALYALSAKTGATKVDSWIDIEGGIGTMFSYSGIARREFANETFIVEGAP